jgi:hypothetical protein
MPRKSGTTRVATSGSEPESAPDLRPQVEAASPAQLGALSAEDSGGVSDSSASLVRMAGAQRGAAKSHKGKVSLKLLGQPGNFTIQAESPQSTIARVKELLAAVIGRPVSSVLNPKGHHLPDESTLEELKLRNNDQLRYLSADPDPLAQSKAADKAGDSIMDSSEAVAARPLRSALVMLGFARVSEVQSAAAAPGSVCQRDRALALAVPSQVQRMLELDSKPISITANDSTGEELCDVERHVQCTFGRLAAAADSRLVAVLDKQRARVDAIFSDYMRQPTSYQDECYRPVLQEMLPELLRQGRIGAHTRVYMLARPEMFTQHFRDNTMPAGFETPSGERLYYSFARIAAADNPLYVATSLVEPNKLSPKPGALSAAEINEDHIAHHQLGEHPFVCIQFTSDQQAAHASSRAFFMGPAPMDAPSDSPGLGPDEVQSSAHGESEVMALAAKAHTSRLAKQHRLKLKLSSGAQLSAAELAQGESDSDMEDAPAPTASQPLKRKSTSYVACTWTAPTRLRLRGLIAH